MNEEPFQTEWFDAQPYPGPEDDTRTLGQIWLDIKTNFVSAFKPVIDDFAATFDSVSGAINSALKNTDSLRVSDLDRPGLPVKNHGPRSRQAFDRRGGKRY